MASARVTALRFLAARRLTEAQLHAKLERKGFDDDAIASAVASCRRDGLLDDALYATLFVETKHAPVGDARLVAELVRRGIDRDAARERVGAAPLDEEARAQAACEKIRRAKPDASYPTVARKLERLGFPASLIYRVLRERAGAEFADALGDIG